MYFWQKPAFKFGIGAAIFVAVVLVILFSNQIGGLLDLFGSKAGTAKTITWEDDSWPTGTSQPLACTPLFPQDGRYKLTLCTSGNTGGNELNNTLNNVLNNNNVVTNNNIVLNNVLNNSNVVTNTNNVVTNTNNVLNNSNIVTNNSNVVTNILNSSNNTSNSGTTNHNTTTGGTTTGTTTTHNGLTTQQSLPAPTVYINYI